MPHTTHLVLAILGVWRVTHLLWGEDGPGHFVVRLRRLAGDGFFGRVLDCFNCLSLWIAAPFAIAVAQTWPERTLTWLGLSGGAILLERLTSHETDRTPPVHNRQIHDHQVHNHQEKHDVLLR